MVKVKLYFPAMNAEECVEITCYGGIVTGRHLFEYLKDKGIKVELITTTEHVESLWYI